MTKGDLAAAVDTNYFDWWRVWASAVDGGDVREHDGLLLATTGAPQEWWNIGFVTRRLERPEERIDEAIAYFDGRRQPFIMRVPDGLDDGSERAAEARGLGYTDTLHGMALAPIPEVTSPQNAVDIRTVADARTVEEHVGLVAQSFGMGRELVRRLMPAKIIEHERWQCYVGYVSGEPAAASALLVTGTAAGVYWVATAEKFRRRGLGEAMTWHAIRKGAKAGCRLAVLQPSDMGRPIYERMGFRVVSGYKTFVRPDLRS